MKMGALRSFGEKTIFMHQYNLVSHPIRRAISSATPLPGIQGFIINNLAVLNVASFLPERFLGTRCLKNLFRVGVKEGQTNKDLFAFMILVRKDIFYI